MSHEITSVYGIVPPMLWLIVAALMVAPADVSEATVEEPGFSETLDLLRKGISLAKLGDADAAIEVLELGLDHFADFAPFAANSQYAQRRRIDAGLSLVYCYQILGQDIRAAAMMDEILRSSGRADLEVTEYGEPLRALYEQRRARFEQIGTGTVAVDCANCYIYVNERTSANPSGELYFGTYRVWVATSQGAFQVEMPINSQAPHNVLSEEIVLEHLATMVDMSLFEEEDSEAPPPPMLSESGSERGSVTRPADEVEVPTKIEDPRPMQLPVLLPEYQRLTPAAAELVGLVIGIGLLAAGTLVMTYDGQCVDRDAVPPDCVTWRSVPVGSGMIVVGSGLVGISGVLFTVDEIYTERTKRRRRQLAR